MAAVTIFSDSGAQGNKIKQILFSWAPKSLQDDYSHEIKRHLLLGRKAMTNLDNILRTGNIALATRVPRACGLNILYFLGLQNHCRWDCSHEIKRHLLLGRKTMTNIDSILKSRDITLPTKVRLVKAMVFPVVMYR